MRKAKPVFNEEPIAIQPSKVKSFGKITKARDLELHVRTFYLGGELFVDIRDYVPSTGQWGKGAGFLLRQLDDLVEILNKVQEHNSTRTTAGVGQGTML